MKDELQKEEILEQIEKLTSEIKDDNISLLHSRAHLYTKIDLTPAFVFLMVNAILTPQEIPVWPQQEVVMY